MNDQLELCRSNFFGRASIKKVWDKFTYLRVPKPDWLGEDPSDRLSVLFDNLEMLYADGTIVWGRIIQANGLLFESGEDNCPGEVVYSLTDRADNEPECLTDIAGRLYQLKGTTPADSELLNIARYLSDEHVRVFGLPVPHSVNASLRCKISTTYFYRKHLPGGRLCTMLLPIVVSRNSPHFAMPLPQKYWPKELVAWWTR
ncbi:hypothetical protein LOC67_17140 [Stieleria sp. JC731]|nr:hypothetical protein [Stieleria sp. JC731]MCC9602282.1 hypothetical protein [Stieleria sp. JC731]